MHWSIIVVLSILGVILLEVIIYHCFKPMFVMTAEEYQKKYGSLNQANLYKYQFPGGNPITDTAIVAALNTLFEHLRMARQDGNPIIEIRIKETFYQSGLVFVYAYSRKESLEIHENEERIRHLARLYETREV